MNNKIYIIVLLCLWGINLNAQQDRGVLQIKVDLSHTAQILDNFGSSGCWFSEGIGKFWPSAKKEEIAKLLFSKGTDKAGRFEGIGLSAWRFNIGAGTLEQGDSSGIKDFRKRADSFLDADGTYDWNKQKGQQFFLKKASEYGVETLIAFSNSPPVQFTKNGLGFKTEKDCQSNLREDRYEAYAGFLADVIKHFDQQNLHFKYVSPVNEPQWDWSKKYMEADQEGTPWTNKEIYKITTALNSALANAKLSSKILIPEAGMLNYLYAGSGKASHQIHQFFDPNSALYVGNLSHVPQTIAGHSYFTDANPQTLVETRKQLADTVRKYNVEYWQSEYSMLGDGFREEKAGARSAMDCALFLSKVIHTDLTVGNATAWQFWNAYEPGKAEENTRYYLIALQPKPDFKDGEFTATKNLWALGHFSRFIRPGMVRLVTEKLEDTSLQISTFKDQENRIVMVISNYGQAPKQLKLDLKNGKRSYKSATTYITTQTAAVDMKLFSQQNPRQLITIQPRSVQTIVIE